MRLLGFGWLVSTALALTYACPVRPLAAQAQAESARTIVFVMEAPGGRRAAALLRDALNRPGTSVVSPSDARRRSLVPDALVTVATDGLRSVEVMYWDRGGRSDALAAAVPATADQLSAVVLALSSALIERHRNDVPQRESAGDDVRRRARLFDERRGSRAVYAMISYLDPLVPRTNVRLNFEDF
jgi:hypothetical protein